MKTRPIVCIIIPAFGNGMGYVANCLPNYLAKKGCEVHIISSAFNAYAYADFYQACYQHFLGDAIQPLGVSQLSANVFLHRLPHTFYKGQVIIKNIVSEIKKTNASVVQSYFDVNSINNYQVAWASIFNHFQFFASSHLVQNVSTVHKSWNNWGIFRKTRWYITQKLPCALVNWRMKACFVPTHDAAYIAEKYYGLNKNKIKLRILGVDTAVFKPKSKYSVESLQQIKEKLSIQNDYYYFLFTGRLTEQKKANQLAKAISELQKDGYKVSMMIIGNGPQLEAIKKMGINHVCLLPFMPYTQLGLYYAICHAAVFPAEESTSMLDAAASGLPLILNENITYFKKICSSAIYFKNDDLLAMKNCILNLLETSIYEPLSIEGIEVMNKTYAWDFLAEERLKDYEMV